MRCEFKEAETNELESIALFAADIWRECYAELLSKEQIEYMLLRFLSAEELRRQKQREGYFYYIIYYQNRRAGFTAFKKDGERLFLSKIYLQKEYRGKGIMPLFWKFIKKQAAQNSCGKIYLTVNRSNSRAVRAYEKQGFKTLYEEDTDIGGGYFMNDYIMQWNFEEN